MFKALLEKGKIFAIIISAFTFGFMHILNWIGGADIVVTLMQIIFASAFGFACAVFIYKTKNIIPCIICHELINTIGNLGKGNTKIDIIFYAWSGVISLAYGIYLLRMNKDVAKKTV